jgi:hypothetical protein
MNGLPCQDAELKARKNTGRKNPLKTLEKLVHEKYAMAKNTLVNTVYGYGERATVK